MSEGHFGELVPVGGGDAIPLVSEVMTIGRPAEAVPQVAPGRRPMCFDRHLPHVEPAEGQGGAHERDRIRKERGILLVMIEHVIRLIMEVSDRVLVLNSGSVLAEGAPDAVRQDRKVIEAYLGPDIDAGRTQSQRLV